MYNFTTILFYFISSFTFFYYSPLPFIRNPSPLVKVRIPVTLELTWPPPS